MFSREVLFDLKKIVCKVLRSWKMGNGLRLW